MNFNHLGLIQIVVACRKKEKLRRKFKKFKSDTDGLKISKARNEFGKLFSQNMRDNLTNFDDITLINKKFFAHIKSASNSHRIPECINYNGILRNDPKEQAELFSEYFFEQFSKKSKYDIPINWKRGNIFDISF